MKFSIRFLLGLTVLVALLSQPAYQYSANLYQQWIDSQASPKQGLTTVVTVPKGGTLIMGGHRFEIEHSEPETVKDYYEKFVRFFKVPSEKIATQKPATQAANQ